jgi:hypothetical protein
MNICYKMQNNITAAHFARAICELESTGVRYAFKLNFFSRSMQTSQKRYLNSRSFSRLFQQRAQMHTN